jgi:hypothetical protein
LSPRDSWSPGPIDLPPICKHLSSDYLNQYREVLRLIEAAPRDEAAADALLIWQAKSYRAYHAQSGPLPISAYEALPGMRRHVFEKLMAEMDMLIEMACFALQWPCNLDLALPVAEITVSGLRGMIGRAATFLDSGGRDLGHPADSETAESILDRIRAVSGPRAAPEEEPPPEPDLGDEPDAASPRAPRLRAHVGRATLVLLAAAAFLYGERMAESSYPLTRQALARLGGAGALLESWCAECGRGGSADVAAALTRAGRQWLAIRQKLPVACPYCGPAGRDT